MKKYLVILLLLLASQCHVAESFSSRKRAPPARIQSTDKREAVKLLKERAKYPANELPRGVKAEQLASFSGLRKVYETTQHLHSHTTSSSDAQEAAFAAVRQVLRGEGKRGARLNKNFSFENKHGRVNVRAVAKRTRDDILNLDLLDGTLDVLCADSGLFIRVENGSEAWRALQSARVSDILVSSEGGNASSFFFFVASCFLAMLLLFLFYFFNA